MQDQNCGDDATLDDLREAVATLEDSEQIARRVFGCTHPLTTSIEDALESARAVLRPSEELAELDEQLSDLTTRK